MVGAGDGWGSVYYYSCCPCDLVRSQKILERSWKGPRGTCSTGDMVLVIWRSKAILLLVTLFVHGTSILVQQHALRGTGRSCCARTLRPPKMLAKVKKRGGAKAKGASGGGFGAPAAKGGAKARSPSAAGLLKQSMKVYDEIKKSKAIAQQEGDEDGSSASTPSHTVA